MSIKENKGRNVSDEMLMLAIKGGDLQAGTTLFERYHEPVYNYFVRQVNDRDLSADLSQNVFERMIKYRHTFNTESLFKAWLFTIARNVRTDHFRRSPVQTIPLETHTEIGSYMTDQVEEDDVQRLYKAMAMLSSEYKEILDLTLMQKIKYKDVSIMLNCAEGTVKSKVHRAINQLRNIFFQIKTDE